MSPLSVAQFIPPNTLEFDLLLIDEASQVRPEEALGAIARSKQIVVVGDQKQLPPTAFFDRMTSQSVDDDLDDDETEQEAMNALLADYATESESILSLCEARGVNNKRLRWHYRSQDSDLIAVSNRLFYENDLIMPPSPSQGGNETGMKYREVQGCYSTASRGGGRAGTNQLEAQYLVDRLAQIIKKGHDHSIGIVAFSVTQRDMILEVLDQVRRDDPALSDFLNEEGPDSLFVKNIENVQGDERDVILISVGYGPTSVGGRLASMSFGPVNREGGERRLNVLFTRAKLRTEIFTSFDWRDIDLARSSAPGVSALKDYLEFAATGRQSTHFETGEGFDSDFERDVADTIKALGFKATPQIGDQGFKIDLGVHHPEQADRFILAVECDGATYHSSLSARERDYHRQKLLESRGWVFHRIWSTDWFYRRSDTIEALKKAIAAALKADGKSHTNQAPIPQTKPEIQPAPVSPPALVAPPVLNTPYVYASLPSRPGLDMLTLSPSQLLPLIKNVVQVEGPVHKDEVFRRIIHSFGLKQLGSRLRAHLDLAFEDFMRSDPDARNSREGFVWLDRQLEAVKPRDRSEAQGATQKASMISGMEIKVALIIVDRENGALEVEERVRAVTSLFGFKRSGRELTARVSAFIA